jgi:SAM-dependent methyltransferase
MIKTHLAPASPPAATQANAPTTDMFERVRCYSCSSDRAAFFIEAEDDLTGRPGRFTFVRCSDCGLVYQNPRLAQEHIKSYYDGNYIAHQERGRWGLLAPVVEWAMGAIDRAKLRIVSRYLTLGPQSSVVDVGCGAGSFLAKVRTTWKAAVAGVDFIDLSARPAMQGIAFHHGLFYEQPVDVGRFDLVTMWHFLEHDYDPLRSLKHAAAALAPAGRLIIEVPRLDSLSARLFGDRWPGLQAPQHTALYDRKTLTTIVRRADLEIVDYLPYGAFPPYFYLFCGLAFCWRKGGGVDLNRAVAPYFAGQIALLPILPILKHLNFAMQTIVCRRPAR